MHAQGVASGSGSVTLSSGPVKQAGRWRGWLLPQLIVKYGLTNSFHAPVYFKFACIGITKHYLTHAVVVCFDLQIMYGYNHGCSGWRGSLTEELQCMLSLECHAYYTIWGILLIAAYMNSKYTMNSRILSIAVYYICTTFWLKPLLNDGLNPQSSEFQYIFSIGIWHMTYIQAIRWDCSSNSTNSSKLFFDWGTINNSVEPLKSGTPGKQWIDYSTVACVNWRCSMSFVARVVSSELKILTNRNGPSIAPVE